ncbi:MAG: hypothetical protein ACT4PV_09845 [Planctomycetaceae bacterium]
MGRRVVVGAVLLLLAWLSFELFLSRATDLVETQTSRLLDLALAGGDTAVDEILAAIAPDYRGDEYPRPQLERLIRQQVGEKRISSLRSVRLSADWVDEEIAVFALLRVGLREGELGLAVRVLFAERDGSWKIVDVKNAQW